MTYSTLILVNSYSCVYWLFICMCTCFWRNVYFILLYILKLCYHLNIELTNSQKIFWLQVSYQNTFSSTFILCAFFYSFNLLCVQVCACTLMHGCAHSCADQRTTFRSWFSFTMWAPGLNSDSQAHRKVFYPESSHRASFGCVDGVLWSMNAFSFWLVACDFDAIKETTVNIYSLCHGVLKFWFSPLGLCLILN